MVEAWIGLNGKIHTGMNHFTIAEKLFPWSSNPEMICEKLGYVKTGYTNNGSPLILNYNPETATQAQINAVEKVWEEHRKEYGC